MGSGEAQEMVGPLVQGLHLPILRLPRSPIVEAIVAVVLYVVEETGIVVEGVPS